MRQVLFVSVSGRRPQMGGCVRMAGGKWRSHPHRRGEVRMGQNSGKVSFQLSDLARKSPPEAILAGKVSAIK